MPVTTACPKCEQRLKLRDDLVGKTVRCPKCEHVFRVSAANGAKQTEKPSLATASPDRSAEPLVASPRKENVPDRPLRTREAPNVADSKTRRGLEPARPARGKPASRENRKTLFWGVGLVAGLFVILACCGAVLWYYANSADKPKSQATVDVRPLKDEVQKPVETASIPPEAPKDPPKTKRTPDQSKDRISFPEVGFSFIPPKGWVPISSKNKAFMNMAAPKQFLLAKSYPADERQMRPNVIASWGPDDGAPADLVAKQIKEDMPKQYKNWKLIDEALITIDGKQTYQIASHFTLQTGATSMDLHLDQYSIHHNNKIYFVSFGAGPKSFAKLREAFEKSAQTIQVD